MVDQLRESTVDVIIPTRNRGALIEATIASILASDFTAFTLWIVDQSDDDQTQQIVARFAASDPRLCYVPTASRGISAARNIGVAVSSAPLILFTDDDCRVTPSWVGAMAQELAAPSTWAVFGLVRPEHTPMEERQDRGRRVSSAINIAIKTSPQRAVYEKHSLNLGFGHGANMGLRRSSFEAVGGFDTLLGVGGALRSWEDRDFGFRVLRAGGRIVYTPEAIVYHRHWRDWAEVWRTYRNYAIGCGAAAGKYIRCGDIRGLFLLGEWIIDQGVRQVASGVLRRRSWQKTAIGLLQLIYPWVGLLLGWRHRVERQHMLYAPKQAALLAEAPLDALANK